MTDPPPWFPLLTLIIFYQKKEQIAICVCEKKARSRKIDACSDLLCINTTVSDENLIEIFGFAPSSVRLEIGCGKGAFVCGMAAREPDVGFLALERVPDGRYAAMEKCKSLGIKNVRFIIGDVMKLWIYSPTIRSTGYT